MKVDKDDLLRLRHMRDYASEAVDFVAHAQREDLETDLKLARALTFSTGVIGEAASRLSESLREESTDIPWTSIIGMRNFLFHEYFHVDNDILWRVATSDIPLLLEQLTNILSE